MAEKKIWYINSKSQTYGPYTTKEVLELIRQGSITYSDYVFREGFSGWEYLYNVSDFDRRLLNPGGEQPIVEAPKATTPVDKPEAKEDGDELWYVHDGESQIGPYSSAYIKEALEKKRVFWTYYVWRDGFDNWVQIKDCKEFDRRVKPRQKSPTSPGISADYNEIKQKAVKEIPKPQGDIYSDKSAPSNFQYGVSSLEQEELKGKYPIKAILTLAILAVVLFGLIRIYPWITHSIRESRAMSMYDKAVGMVENEKPEQGFAMLYDLLEIYPGTRATRRQQNYVRSKEPTIKSKLADEARDIKGKIEEYIRIYGVMPANSIDINHTPSYWLRSFGELYYRRDLLGRAEVVLRGLREPVESYVFYSFGDGRESESSLSEQEFFNISRDYTKLVYTGSRSSVRPIETTSPREEPPTRPRLPSRLRQVIRPDTQETEETVEARPETDQEEEIPDEEYFFGDFYTGEEIYLEDESEVLEETQEEVLEEVEQEFF